MPRQPSLRPLVCASGSTIAVLLGLCVLVPSPSAAQQPAKSASAAAPTLSAQDYLDIQQLVVKYAFALDSGAQDGHMYSDLFAPDAEFIRPYTKGRENLARLALDQPHGPLFVRHFITNHVIDPAPGGATGKQYLVVIDINDTYGQPGSIFLIGHYEDQYVKTAQGWRFRRREFIPAQRGSGKG